MWSAISRKVLRGASVPRITLRTSSDTVAALRARLERAEREATAHQRQLERYAADLRESYRRERARAQQLRRSYKATVRALSNAVEARDAYTGKHAERVAAYGLAIARAAGIDVADEPQMEFGFLLHDIGKVGVPDAILFKPAALSTGRVRAASPATPRSASTILRHVDFLDEATLIVRHHHERWDGTGYPDGLEGEQIPLARARVRGRRHARRADDGPALSQGGGLARGARGDPARLAARSSTPRWSPPTTRSATTRSPGWAKASARPAERA